MSTDIRDINFASIVEMLEAMNAGYVHVGVNEYHYICCTEEAFRVMERAYDEWLDQEEGAG